MNSRALLKSMLVPIVAVGVVGYVGWSYVSGSCPLCRLGSTLTPSTLDQSLPPSAGSVTPPGFSATTLDGQRVSLDTYKGKVVLLDFWATWCGPCVRAMPDVVAVKQKFGARGLAVVGVSSDRDETALRTFLAAHPEVDWPQLFQPGLQGFHPLADAAGVTAIPRLFLIDRKGTLRAVDAGKGLAEEVARLLAE